MALTNSGAQWAEEGATAALTRLQLEETSPGVYEFTTTTLPDGSLVSDGAGGYVITPGDLTGTGTVAQLPTGDAIIY